jgi:methionine-rich copper-binding protein CopC
LKALLIALLISSFASSVAAHSPVETTTPENGATLPLPPENVTIVFKDNIRLTRVTAALGDGAAVDLDISAFTSFATDFTLALANSNAGPYLITWRGLSQDGHPQTGTFTFKVN